MRALFALLKDWIRQTPETREYARHRHSSTNLPDPQKFMEEPWRDKLKRVAEGSTLSIKEASHTPPISKVKKGDIVRLTNPKNDTTDSPHHQIHDGITLVVKDVSKSMVTVAFQNVKKTEPTEFKIEHRHLMIVQPYKIGEKLPAPHLWNLREPVADPVAPNEESQRLAHFKAQAEASSSGGSNGTLTDEQMEQARTVDVPIPPEQPSDSGSIIEFQASKNPEDLARERGVTLVDPPPGTSPSVN